MYIDRADENRLGAMATPYCDGYTGTFHYRIPCQLLNQPRAGVMPIAAPVAPGTQVRGAGGVPLNVAAANADFQKAGGELSKLGPKAPPSAVAAAKAKMDQALQVVLKLQSQGKI